MRRGLLACRWTRRGSTAMMHVSAACNPHSSLRHSLHDTASAHRDVSVSNVSSKSGLADTPSVATETERTGGKPPLHPGAGQLRPSSLPCYHRLPARQAGSAASAEKLSRAITGTAAQRLQEFLALRELPSGFPPRSARTLRLLYYSARTASDLSTVGPMGLSALISLLGSLSISKPGVVPQSIHMHPLVHHMPITSFRPQWTFIVHVAQSKRALGYNLLPSDRYWLMRGELVALDEQDGDGEDSYPIAFWA